MSRERAQRRAARQAAAARRVAQAETRAARATRQRRRRDRRRSAVRAALPWQPGQRWSRRTRVQRATVAAALLGVLVITWLATPSWSIRIAVVLAAVVVTPALIVLVLDRSSR